MATILVALFVDGGFESIEQSPNLDHALGFAIGIGTGVGMFDGGRSGKAYALPSQEAAMHDAHNAAEVERALRAAAIIRAKLGE